MDSGDKKHGCDVRIANRLWGQQGLHFAPAYLQLTWTDYGAELAQVNFSQTEAARTTINRWVEEQTENKIQNLIPSGGLDANTRLVLTNAIYFKASWSHRFEKMSTTDAPFHISAAQQVAVPMMHQSHSFRYSAADNLQIVELPYGTQGQLSMLVLLPRQIEGLVDLQKRLTGDNLRKWTNRLEAKPVEVSLPRFKVTAQFQLNTVLESMGMTLAFDSKRADFSGISSDGQLFISAIFHKAFVDVNEEGTEAAAATGVTMKPSAMRVSDPPIVFRADHPFVFVIRDNRTESILFVGQVVNLKATN